MSHFFLKHVVVFYVFNHCNKHYEVLVTGGATESQSQLVCKSQSQLVCKRQGQDTKPRLQGLSQNLTYLSQVANVMVPWVSSAPSTFTPGQESRGEATTELRVRG